MKFFKTVRRPVFLLEVIIAIFIFTMVSAVLLQPSIGMLLQEKKLVRSVQKEQMLQQAQREMIEALYYNQIPWSHIKDGLWHQREGRDYFYQFIDRIHKPKGEEQTPLFYLFDVQIALVKGGVQNKWPVMIEYVPEDRA